MTNKPIIGITSAYVKHNHYMEGVYVHHDYHKAVIEAGGIPLILPIAPSDVLDEYINLCDGFILSGGEDIDPRFYNESPHPKLGFFYTERDESEIYLTKRIIEKKKPVIAICRGFQLVNVVLGGTLYQDIPSQLSEPIQHVQTINRSKSSHTIDIDKNSKLYALLNESTIFVNSLHHQGIKKLANGLKAVATSPDGLIEAVELKDDTSPLFLGIQWHPESMSQRDDVMKSLFLELVHASKN